MPHPPRLVVGGDCEGDLTRHLPRLGNLYCTCADLCSADLMKEIASVEENYPVQIPYYDPPPTNLGG